MAAWTGRRRWGLHTWGVTVLVASALIWAWAPPVHAQVTITQITDSGSNFEPSISASGTRVTFRSFANLANPVGCPPGCPVLPGNATINVEVSSSWAAGSPCAAASRDAITASPRGPST